MRLHSFKVLYWKQMQGQACTRIHAHTHTHKSHLLFLEWKETKSNSERSTRQPASNHYPSISRHFPRLTIEPHLISPGLFAKMVERWPLHLSSLHSLNLSTRLQSLAEFIYHSHLQSCLSSIGKEHERQQSQYPSPVLVLSPPSSWLVGPIWIL